MKLSGKQQVLNTLQEQAEELREWMMDHSTPETPVSEFEIVANRHAILSVKIRIIEKQWK